MLKFIDIKPITLQTFPSTGTTVDETNGKFWGNFLISSAINGKESRF